jgi:predicted aspartyl protease
MKRPYNQAYFPPIPVLQACFSCELTGLYTDDVLCLVDTGADTSVAPVYLLEQIGAAVDGFGRLHGQWGGTRQVSFYLVDVTVEGVTFSGILVAGDKEGHDVLLGRDVLNRMRLLFDGLGLELELVSY